MESDYLLTFIALALVLACVFFVVRCREPVYMSQLPPGPYAWQLIIGSMFMSPKALFTDFAQKYGPLFSVRLGALLFIVASSSETVMEMFKVHEQVFSGRYVPSVFHRVPQSDNFILNSKECNDNWKSVRGLCNRQLFSIKAIEMRSDVRKKKLAEMMNYLRMKEGEIVNLRNVVFTTLANSMVNLMFSSDLTNFERECEGGNNQGFNGSIEGLVQNVTSPSVFDFFPGLKGLFGFLETRKGIKLHEKFKSLWGRFIEERRVAKKPSQDILDALIESGYCDDAIIALSMELFLAGVHTTMHTIEWLMAELIKDRRVMLKVCSEAENVLVNGDFGTAALSSMPYLQACLKETLRLHPPGLFVVPHCALQTCTLNNNYVIPKDSIILINNWTMGRDPTIWDEPLKFKPERFLQSVLRQNIQFSSVPFGVGRRTCPAVNVATTNIQAIVAVLVHYFEWFFPQGMSPDDINLSETAGMLLSMKEPLILIPSSRTQ